MSLRASPGFTLIETLVAMGIAVFLGFFIISATASMLHWSTLQAQREGEHAAIEELVDRFRADEDSAWAIFTPATDVNGASNTDGHEVDFFTRDAKYQSYFWAYTYDAHAQTLSRYLYAAPGGTPSIDQTYPGISAFYARTYPITALQDPTSAIYSPLYNGAVLQSGAVRFYGAANPSIAGGNQVTYVRIDGPSMARTMQLSTNTAPSGFTVVLSYTPAPSATATPKAAPLQAWPSNIELPINGQALQTSWLPPKHDIAYYVNRLLGGGIANAALSPCATNQARAFTDSNFTTPYAEATPPPGALPAGVTGYTDAGGCVTIDDAIGSNVELYEPGNTTPLAQTSNSCGLSPSITNESPSSAAGPNVGLRAQGSKGMLACTMVWSDGHAQPTTTTVFFEVSGCSAMNATSYQLDGIGSICAGKSVVPSQDQGDCGETDIGVRVQSGPGSVSGNAASFQVTRTGHGTIEVLAQWNEKWTASSGHGCTSKTYNETFTYGE